MKKDKHITKAQFLIEKPEGDLPRNVFAFFPELKNNNKNTFSCYAHIGQHSVCSLEYASNCEEASPEQYKELMQELESIGYNLEIVKK